MPYINTTTTKKITPEIKKTLVEKLGKAIEIIPGKTDEWLMLNFNSEAQMAFRSTELGGAAMVEVEILGTASADDKEKLTEAICKIVTEVLGISGERTYVTYREVDTWGYNGMNF